MQLRPSLVSFWRPISEGDVLSICTVQYFDRRVDTQKYKQFVTLIPCLTCVC
jgi:hypothetical protein